MKKINLLMVLALGLIFASCEKDSNDKEGIGTGCFRVKILNEVCGTAVLQILDSSYYALGTNGYQQEGVTYDHVFSSEISCIDMEKFKTFAPSLKGIVVNIQVLKSQQYDPACTRCAAVVPNAPANWLPVQFVEDCVN